MTIGVPIVTGLPRLYQQCIPTVYQSSQTVKTQSKRHKNDHWCTSRHMHVSTVKLNIRQNTCETCRICCRALRLIRLTGGAVMFSTCPSTKTVPTVYQQCTKNSQNTVKTAKMTVTIGVPIVTGLPRLYQQCNILVYQSLISNQ